VYYSLMMTHFMLEQTCFDTFGPLYGGKVHENPGPTNISLLLLSAQSSFPSSNIISFMMQQSHGRLALTALKCVLRSYNARSQPAKPTNQADRR
jgi:hypothetical protein